MVHLSHLNVQWINVRRVVSLSVPSEKHEPHPWFGLWSGPSIIQSNILIWMFQIIHGFSFPQVGFGSVQLPPSSSQFFFFFPVSYNFPFLTFIFYPFFFLFFFFNSMSESCFFLLLFFFNFWILVIYNYCIKYCISSQSSQVCSHILRYNIQFWIILFLGFK